MKRVTIIFIFCMIITTFLLLFTISLGTVVSFADKELDNLKSELNVSLQDDDIDDVEGYGIIVQGLGYGLGALANAVIFVIAILIGIYTLLLFVLALVAKLIFAPEGGRLLAYRILMGFEYALQVGIAYVLASMTLNSFSLTLLALTLFVTAGTVFCCVNTYSHRILN